MFKSICTNCHGELSQISASCPHCHTTLCWEGHNKNTHDQIIPDCLIHRYQGSDLLEPAAFLKNGKINVKVALTTPIGVKQITVPKQEVFQLDNNILNSITDLRQSRCQTMADYDNKISAYWNNLSPYTN